MSKRHYEQVASAYQYEAYEMYFEVARWMALSTRETDPYWKDWYARAAAHYQLKARDKYGCARAYLQHVMGNYKP